MFQNLQSGELFIVKDVLSEVNPPLYKLQDLMNAEVPGFYYGKQLTKTKKPEDENYFLVEKILSEKLINNKKFFLVKANYSNFRRTILDQILVSIIFD